MTKKSIGFAKPALVSTEPQVVDEPSLFDIFYRHYPRKQAKKAAKKAWKRLDPSEILTQKIISDLKLRLKKGDWDLSEKCFIPLPASYLNGERWEDELIPRGGHFVDYSAIAKDAQELIK